MSEVFEFQSADWSKVGKNAGIDRVVVNYKLLKGPKAGEVWSTGTLAMNLDEESRAALKTLSPGDLVNLDIGRNEQNYRCVNAVRTVDAAEAAVQKQAAAAAPRIAHDNTIGIKVGAARNQAIAFLSATRGKKFTLDDVDAVAYEIVGRQAEQEKHVKAGVIPPAAQSQVENNVVTDGDTPPF